MATLGAVLLLIAPAIPRSQQMLTKISINTSQDQESKKQDFVHQEKQEIPVNLSLSMNETKGSDRGIIQKNIPIVDIKQNQTTLDRNESMLDDLLEKSFRTGTGIRTVKLSKKQKKRLTPEELIIEDYFDAEASFIEQFHSF